MADGDITSIKELGRYTIPGSGRSIHGLAQNDKVVAWGQLTGTYETTGLDLAAKGGRRALGVADADFVGLTVRTSNAAVPAADTQFLANLDISDKIFVCDQVGTANPAVPTPGEIIVIDYVIMGTDARNTDLV
jgi:hypothetical protein